MAEEIMNFQYIVDLGARQFIQLSAAILAVGVVTRLFCRRRPHLEYVLWLLVVLKSLTPPIWSSPTGIFSLMNWERQRDSVSPKLSIAAISNASVDVSSEAIPPAEMPSGTPRLQIPRLVFAMWAAGGASLLLAFAARWLVLRRRIEMCSVPATSELGDMVDDLRKSLGIRRRMRLRLCNQPIGPAVFGIVRPILILPEEMLQYTGLRQIQPILAHEMLHLRRNDPLIFGLQFLSQAIWWFHPLVWWMNRKINRVREVCCDAEVLASRQCEPIDYAQMLIDLARRRRLLPITPSLGIRPVEITAQRLSHIMSAANGSHLRTPRRYWAAMAIGALALLPGAGVSPSRAADNDTQIPVSRPAEPGTGQASGIMAPEQRVRHFVAVVVGLDSLTCQGQQATIDRLPSLLERVPDREHTVLELAYSSGDVTIGQFNAVQSRLMDLVTRFGFEYLSLTGQHAADYKGGPDQIVVLPAAQPPQILPALTPARDSQLTHQLDFRLGQTQFLPGDSITITEVRGTSDALEVDGTYQVKGTYTLASLDHATLALSVSAKDSKNARGNWGAKQTVKITRGSGTFTLTDRMGCEGYPHVSFYTETGSVGGVYFGTGAWLLPQ
jgi:beta-lactamase regulating signal transducer with metallopeptidase domain